MIAQPGVSDYVEIPAAGERVVTLSGRELKMAAAEGRRSALTRIVAAVREGLLVGSGLVRITGADLTSLHDRDLEALHIRIGRELGRLMPQTLAGGSVVRVEDERPTDPESARGFRSNTAMKPHTDGWDAAGLMCLRPARRGGESVFVSSRRLLATAMRERPDLARLLLDVWDWDVRVLVGDPSHVPLRSPIFSWSNGSLSCRFGSYLLRHGGDAAGQPLSRERIEALEYFEGLAMRQDLILERCLQRGESVWMNNRRILHGRRAFDDSGVERGRLMLRVWIRLYEPPPIDDSFLLFDRACFGEGN